MATVSFHCGQCGKAIAVEKDHLGKRVRCPHCQQVIEAPAADTAAPALALEPGPELVFSIAPPVQQESIFEGAEEAAGDALFAGSPQSLVEMPPETPPAAPPLEVTAPPGPEVSLQVEAAPDHRPVPPPETLGPPPGPAYEATVTFASPEPTSPPDPALTSTAPAPNGFAALAELPAGPPPGPAVELPAGGELLGEPGAETALTLGADFPVAGSPPARAARAARGGLLTPILLIFLIPYSLFTTAALVMLWMRKQEPSLEILPDPEPGKDRGGPERRGKGGQRVRNTLPVPPRLRGQLGEAIRVGDVQVIPQRAEQLANRSLALVLKMVNRSPDVEFNPVCQAFNKYNPGIPADLKPYTFLEIGPKERVYGGQWSTTRAGRLGPGEDMTATLTTAPLDADQRKALRASHGPLLWRVQVRRGFVQVRERDISATAVVGVEFQGRDVRKEEVQMAISRGKPGGFLARKGARVPIAGQISAPLPPFFPGLGISLNNLLLGQHKSHCQSLRAIYN
jgi:DNA-directed RNA polymerase subunit RPC12/RpoP